MSDILGAWRAAVGTGLEQAGQRLEPRLGQEDRAASLAELAFAEHGVPIPV